MTAFLLSGLYLTLSVVLGILAYTLKKKRTKFPDCRVGFHHKAIMESREKWEYGNRLAGNLCAVFSAVGIIIAAILYMVEAGTTVTISAFFIYAFTSIATVLFLPVWLSKKI